MAPRAITVRQITPHVIEQFVAEKRVSHRFPRSPKALLPLLRYLRSLELVAPAEAPEVSSSDLLQAYDRYLVKERGVKQGRHHVCMKAARDFLEGRDVAQLSAADVTTFVSEIRDQSSLVGRLSGLRSVLSYLFLQGHTTVNLVPAVPSVARRRLAALPQAIDEAQIDAVLSTRDRRTSTPLTGEAVKVLRAWLKERDGNATEPVLPSRRGTTMSRDAVERLVTKHTDQAARSCRSLQGKCVTPHVLRHTTAVTLLQAGVDRAVIALWLGHEGIETTQMYLDADLSTKERALARTAPIPAAARRFRPDDRLLAFLHGL
jgi:site-specific recombinase XerD